METQYLVAEHGHDQRGEESTSSKVNSFFALDCVRRPPNRVGIRGDFRKTLVA